MRKLYFTLLIISLALVGLQAQYIEGAKSMSQGTHNAVTVKLKDVDQKEIEKLWQSYIKDADAKKPKRDRKTKEYLGDDATILGLSNNTIDIYSTFDSKGDHTEMNVWFDLGGAYYDSKMHADKTATVNAWLKGFERNVKERAIENQIDGQEKELKDMEKDMKKLKRDNEKLHEEIEKFQQQIKENEAAIITNEGLQKEKENEIQIQEKVIEETKTQLRKLD